LRRPRDPQPVRGGLLGVSHQYRGEPATLDHGSGHACREHPARSRLVNRAPTFADLARSTPRQLEGIFREGATPSPDALAGSLWRGYNVGWPPAVLRIRKLIQGFFRGGAGAAGYETTLTRNGP